MSDHPSEADRETLAKVYQAQYDEWARDLDDLTRREDALLTELVPLEAEAEELRQRIARTSGRLDMLRDLAERDGVQLTGADGLPVGADEDEDG